MLVVGLFLLIHSQNQSAKSLSACGFRSDRAVSINSQKIEAEVADSNQTREQGLSGRPCIGRDEGMLFVFDRPSFYYFWMKNMKFPIDIVWISADHRVVGLKTNALPSSYPQKYGNKGNSAQYVLEIAAGRAASLHVSPGTNVNF